MNGINNLKWRVAHHERDMDIARERILTATREILPPGTVVRFRHGQMDPTHGEVVRIDFHVTHVRITLRNLRTGKDRRVPLDSILGVHRP